MLVAAPFSLPRDMSTTTITPETSTTINPQNPDNPGPSITTLVNPGISQRGSAGQVLVSASKDSTPSSIPSTNIQTTSGIVSVPIHSTTTTVSCFPSTIAVNQGSTCTAYVTDASAGPTTPFGVVLVSLNNTSTATGSISGGGCGLGGISSATSFCSVSFTPSGAGSAFVTALYGGDAAHSPSQGEFTASVPVHPTTTTVSCVSSSVVVSQASTCTATIADLSASPTTPSGDVLISLNSTSTATGTIGACQLGGINSADSFCSVNFTPSGSGTGVIDAFYSGDTAHSISSAQSTVTVSGTAGSAVHPTTTSVACSPASTAVSQPSTCTVTVVDTLASPTSPSGAVLFSLNSTSTASGGFGPIACGLGGVNPSTSSCSVNFNPTGAGTGFVNVVYGGDATHSPSLGQSSVTVLVHSTTTSVVCSPSSVAVNQASTCTVSVTDNALSPVTPTGPVLFSLDPASAAAGSFNGGGNACGLGRVSVATSSCSVNFNPIGAGVGVVDATYDGDTVHSVSSARSTVTVLVHSTTTSVVCSPAIIGVGQTSTCTVSVTDNQPAPVTPSGPVLFSLDGSSSASGLFNGGGNACGLGTVNPSTSSCSVSFVPSGSGAGVVVATYDGDTVHFVSSGRFTINVLVHTTRTTVSCTPASTATGQSSTCTVFVRDTTAAPATPSGIVLFSLNATSTAAGSFSGGGNVCGLSGINSTSSDCSVSFTGSGSGTGVVDASYGGDPAHAISSGRFTVSVPVDSTTTSVVCSPSSIAVSQASTCTVFVRDNSLAPVTPPGIVLFSLNATSTATGSFGGSVCGLGGINSTTSSCPTTFGASGSGTAFVNVFYGGDSAHSVSSAKFTLSVSGSLGSPVHPTATTVSCVPSSLVVSQASTCTVSVTDTSSGPTTPSGYVLFSVNGTSIASGTFSSGYCGLGGINTAESICSVNFRPTGPGATYVSAIYSGDLAHQLSTGQVTMSALIHSTTTSVSCIPTSMAVSQASTCTVVVTDTSAGPTTPTGYVLFSLNRTSTATGSISSGYCGLGAVNSATSTCSVSFTPSGAGIAFVTAQYGGDASHSLGQGRFIASIPLHSTSSNVSCVVSTIAVGQASTCTVVVTDTSAGPAGPVGTVLFIVNSTSTATGTISGGGCGLGNVNSAMATCSVSFSASGHGTAFVTAIYGGDAAHSGSSSFTVNTPLHSTITNVSCSPSSTGVNGPSNCTVSVTDNSASPTVPSGTVLLGLAGPSSASGTFSGGGGCGLGRLNIATTLCTVIFAPSGPGTAVVSASYNGDSAHSPSSTSFTITVSGTQPASGIISVPAHSTTTTVSCVPSSVIVSQASTCTATVMDLSTSPTTPAGDVLFGINDTSIATGSLGPCGLGGINSAVSTCTINFTPSGSGTAFVTAVYGGDAAHNPSLGESTVTVSGAAGSVAHPTTTTVSCSPASVAVSQPSTCTVTVVDTLASPTTPSGYVIFVANSTSTATGTFSPIVCGLGGVNPSTSSCSVNFNPSGTGTGVVIVVYGGDSTHLHSVGQSSVTVLVNSTTTSVVCSPASISVNQPSTCTVSVTDNSPTPFTPTGPVLFSLNNTSTASGNFNGGSNACGLGRVNVATSSCSLNFNPTGFGTGVIVVTYDGDTVHSVSSGTTNVSVLVHSTTTTVVCSPVSVVVGQTSTCTVSVTDNSPTPFTPTGPVLFSLDSTGTASGNFNGGSNACGLGTVNPSTASCSVGFTPSGSGLGLVAATYDGDLVHSLSSGRFTVSVPVHPTRTTVSCSPSSIAVGLSSSCTVFVRDTSTAPVTPSGVVLFSLNSTSTAAGSFNGACGLVAVNATSSDCAVTFTGSGSGTGVVDAGYGGDASHAASLGLFTLTVPVHSTVTGVSCSPSSVTVGQASTCTVFVRDTSPNPVSPPGLVLFYLNGTSTATGSFGGNYCGLGPVNSTVSTCAVSFTASGSGTAVVDAASGGNAAHAPSSALSTLTVSGSLGAPVHPTTTTVSCVPSSLGINQVSVCTAYVTDTSSGPTTPSGTVLFSLNSTSTATGSFNGGSSACGLSGLNSAESICSVSFTASGAGTGFVTALNGGDAAHSPSLGRSITSVLVHSTTTTVGGGLVANVAVGTGPWGMAYDSSNGYVYATNLNANTVSVISGTTVVATIPVGNTPAGVGYDSGNGYIYVANNLSNNVSVINGTTNIVVATVPAGANPTGVVYDSKNGYVYVTNSNSLSVTVIDGTTIVTQVSVGHGTTMIAYDSGNGYVYAATGQGNSVSVIDGTTVLASIPVQQESYGVAYDSGNGYVYVTNANSNTVSVINGTSVVATVQVGSIPYFAAYDSGNGYIYVTNSGSNTTSVISGTTVVSTIQVGTTPYGVAYDTQNGYVYVADFGSNTVNVISSTTLTLSCVPSSLAVGQASTCTVSVTDTSVNPTTPSGTVIFSLNGASTATGSFSGNTCGLGSVNSGESICSVSFTPSGAGMAFVTALYGGDAAHSPSQGQFTVFVLIHSTSLKVAGNVVANVTVGTEPYYLAYDAANGYVYVSNFNSGTVSIIDGTTVGSTLPVGTNPYGVTYDSGNGYVYVANAGSDTVSVIKGTTVLATISVGVNPYGVAYDNANGYIYVANSNCPSLPCSPSTVSVISGTTVVATVSVGSQPVGVGYDSGNGYIYVANDGSNTISVINGTTVVATIPVGINPNGVGYDSGNGDIYVANTSSNTVSVISGTIMVGTVSVGSEPVGVGYDSGDGNVYVANAGSDTVSVISGNTVVATIPVGSLPEGVAYDSGNGYVYVANYHSGNVGVIPTTTIAVSCTPRSLAVGQASICTVYVTDTSVSPTSPSGIVLVSLSNTSTATGTVSGGGCSLGNVNSATATCSISFTAYGAGTALVTAFYGGDRAHSPSHGQFTVSVPIHSTTTSISCVPSTIAVNQAATCSTYVTDTSASPTTPSGTVLVSLSNTSTATGAVSGGGCGLGTVNSATSDCSITFTALGSGTVCLVALYGGDSAHAGSSSFCLALPTDFTFSTTPATATVLAGQTATSTVAVAGVNGFTDTVNLSVSISPSTGLTCTLSQASVNLSSTTTSGTSTLSCNGSALTGGVGPSAYTVTLTGTGATSGKTHSATFSVTVTDFAVSASPTSVTVFAGQAGNSTITISRINGFTGTITLTDSVSPATGLTCTLTPAAITAGSGTSKLSCSGTTNSYVVTVTGTSGSTGPHSTTVRYTVRNIPSGQSRLYVGNYVSNNTMVIDPSTNTVLATVNSGNGPYWVLFDPANHDVYVSNSITNTVSVINSTTDAVVATVNLGGSPRGLAYDPSNGDVYVAVAIASSTVDVIDPSSNTVVATISVGSNPYGIAYDPANGDLYVAITGGASVSVIDPNSNSVIANIDTGAGTSPHGVAFDTFNKEIYVANYQSGTVSVINGTTNTIVATLNVGSNPVAVAYDSSNNEVYVTNQLSNTVSVIDSTGNTVVASVNVGNGPYSIAFDSANDELYVANTASGTVSVISDTTNTVVANITVGSDPIAVAVSPPFDYSLSNNGPVTIVAGGSGSATITAKLTSGASQQITLSCLTNSLPVGITCGTLTVNPVTPTPRGTVSNLTINVASSVSPGSYTITVTGSPSGVTTNGASATVTVNVIAAPDFRLSASPTTATVLAGQTATSTVTVTGQNGFTDTVNLATSISPSTGLTCTLSPASVSLSSSATSAPSTLSCNGSALFGGLGPSAYTVTVTGTGVSTSKSHSATFTVTVEDFGLSASPTSVSPTVGVAGTSTIAVGPLPVTGIRFSGTVSFTVTTNSTGLSCIAPTSVTGGGMTTLSCTGSVAGNYNATVTGTSSSLSHSVSVIYHVLPTDFTISVSPTSATVFAGQPATTNVNVTGLNGFADTLNLSTSVGCGFGCTPSLTCTFSPTSLALSSTTKTATSALTCSGGAIPPIGGPSYTVTVTGTGATSGKTHSTTFTVTVQDFSLSASPTSVSPTVGVAGTSTIRLLSFEGGFSGTVMLSVSTNSTSLSCTLSTTSIGFPGSSTLSCTGSAAGNYNATVTGTSSSLSHSVSVLYHVIPTDFTISANPTAAVVLAGQSATSTVTVAGQNGFTDIVNLAASISPSTGLSCTLSPGSVSLSSSSTSASSILSCSGSALFGGLGPSSYSVTITGTGASSGKTHATSFTVTVEDFTISANPAGVSSTVGVAGTSSIMLGSLPVTGTRFSGTVLLAVTTNSTNLSCTVNPTSDSFPFSPATLSCTGGVAGNYNVTVTGTSSSLNHSVSVIYHVTNVPEFNINASPTGVNANTGASGVSTISIAPVNGFTGTVTLVVTTNSTNLSCTLSPTSITGGSGPSTLSCTGSPAGNYLATVTGTSGSLSHFTTVTYHIQDFTVTASPTSRTLNAGATGTSAITVAAVNGFTGPVTLAVTTNSTNLSCTLSLTSIGGSGVSTLSCFAAVSGNYLATVTGTSGTTLSHSATVVFHVQDLAISASPTSVTLNSGVAGSSTITVASVNGFAGTVALLDTTNSTNLSCTLSSASITGGSGISTLSCTSSVAGNYLATVTGSSGGLSHSATVTFHVQNFTIAASPTSVSVNAGTTGTSTITVAPVNGFAGTVTLAVTTNSTSLSCTLGATTITGASGTSTLSCTGSPPGNYGATITAASGTTLSHSANIAFHVQDFTITSSTSSVSVTTGSMGTATITVSPLNSFASTVGLAVTTNSTNLSCTLSVNTIAGGSGPSTLSCGSSVAGNYLATVTGTSATTLSHSVGVVYHVRTSIHTTSTIVSCSPSSVTVGSATTCTVTVTDTSAIGSTNPTGTVTFAASGTGSFAPSSAACSLSASGTNAATCQVTFTPGAVGSGSQSISASYSGDSTHSSSVSTTSFTLTVTKSSPTISSTVTPASITIGGAASDLATLTGGFSPTGTITYTAYTDFACTTLAFTSASMPLGTSSGAFTPSGAGTYHWIGSYSGDANNNAVATTCGASGETLTVAKATPTLTSTVTPSTITIGSSATDLATLSGGHNPSGAVTYSAYSDSSCATLVFTSASVPLGTSSAAFTPSATGTYLWIASYSGDSNNNAVATTCGAAGETLTINGVAFDYSLSVSPVSASIIAGSSTSATVTATLTRGTTQPVTLYLSAVSPLPSICLGSSQPCGPTTFTPLTITPSSTGATSTMKIATTSIVPPGTYTLTIAGSPVGSSSSSATFTLTIAAPFVSTVGCGHDQSCSVMSNSTLTHVKFAGITIHAEADGPKGAHCYANITVPKSAIPNIDNLHVFVDNNKLARSDVTITSNSTDYFIYFTFTFHSPVQIDIQLTAPENAPSLILGLDPTLFYEIVGALVAILVVVVAVAVRATRHRSKASNPRQQ